MKICKAGYLIPQIVMVDKVDKWQIKWYLMVDKKNSNGR